MRIGIDTSFLRPEALHTGMGAYTRGLVKGLAAVPGADEFLLLGYGPRPDGAPDGMAWHSIPRLPAGKAALWVSHQVSVPLLARRLRLDLVHLTGVNLRLSQPGLPFFMPCPTVITVHDAIPVTYYGRQGPALPWRLRLGYRVAASAIRRAEGIVTVSSTSRRDIVDALRVPPERVTVVYNGLERGSEPGLEEARRIAAMLEVPSPYLLYVGSYEPRKNLVGTVAAYRIAQQRASLPPLVLVVDRGSGHRNAALETISLQGTDDLIFLDSLTQQQLTALYRGAAMFVYPSHYEGFGFNPLDAAAQGTPVIASSTGSLPEVLGDAALYVDPNSPEEIADAIVHLHGNSELSVRLSELGRRQAQRYSWERAAREMVAVYQRIARPENERVRAEAFDTPARRIG